MAKQFLVVIGTFVGIFPRFVQCYLGKILGSLACLILKKRRRVAVENLITAGYSENAEKICRSSFQHLGMCLVETLLLMRFHQSLRPWMIFEDQELLFDPQDPQATVMLSAHIGNWEVLGSYANFGAPIFGLYRPQKQKFADDCLRELRSRTGMSMLSAQNALKESYRVLQRGGILGNVGDQGSGLIIRFLGQDSRFPEGPARLAQKTGARLLFYACVREGYFLRSFCVREIKTANRSAEDIMREYAQALEQLIQKYPEQYFWVHDLWKRFKEDKR